MIKTRAWGHHGCFLGAEGDLGRGMVAFLGLGGGEGDGEGPLGCGRKRTRSRRGPPVVEVAVAETGEAEGVVGEVEVEEKGCGKEGAACVKACVDCGSTKTPLWRGGPAGPKTLCNACGIRCRKMRRKVSNGNSSSAPAVDSDGGRVLRMEEEEKVMRQRQRRKQEGLWLLLQQSRKFRSVCGEEEADAAVLLMALSTGLFLH